ncbi:MAG: hypothetical protein WAK34_00415, partial [Rhodoplanes sp.]
QPVEEHAGDDADYENQKESHDRVGCKHGSGPSAWRKQIIVAASPPYDNPAIGIALGSPRARVCQHIHFRPQTLRLGQF